MTSEQVIHSIEPIYDNTSKILILGTFPSVKSRECSFYYGHPQNRFWRVLSSVLNCEVPKSVDEKRSMLIKNNIALWDVIKSCEISGSADSTIKSVVPNDISIILNQCDIKQIFANGKTAEKLYNSYIKKTVKRSIIALPSTSPANASFRLDDLIEKWNIIIK